MFLLSSLIPVRSLGALGDVEWMTLNDHYVLGFKMHESFGANRKHLNYFEIGQSPYDSVAFLLSLILEFELQYYLNNQTQ